MARMMDSLILDNFQPFSFTKITTTHRTPKPPSQSKRSGTGQTRTAATQPATAKHRTVYKGISFILHFIRQRLARESRPDSTCTLNRTTFNVLTSLDGPTMNLVKVFRAYFNKNATYHRCNMKSETCIMTHVKQDHSKPLPRIMWFNYFFLFLHVQPIKYFISLVYSFLWVLSQMPIVLLLVSGTCYNR